MLIEQSFKITVFWGGGFAQVLQGVSGCKCYKFKRNVVFDAQRDTFMVCHQNSLNCELNFFFFCLSREHICVSILSAVFNSQQQYDFAVK